MSKSYGKMIQNGTFANTGTTLIGFDGGVDRKTDDMTSKPPQLSAADNVWNITPGVVRALPPLIQGRYNLNLSNNSTNCYGIYDYNVQEPFIQGQPVAWSEVANGAMTSPMLSVNASAQGFPTSNIETKPSNPVYPITMRARALNASAVGDLAGAGNQIPSPSEQTPLYAYNASTGMGMSIVITRANATTLNFLASAASGVANTLSQVEASGTLTIVSTQAIQADLVACGTGFVLAVVGNSSGSTTQLNMYGVTVNGGTVNGLSVPLVTQTLSAITAPLNTVLWSFCGPYDGTNTTVSVYTLVGGALARRTMSEVSAGTGVTVASGLTVLANTRMAAWAGQAGSNFVAWTSTATNVIVNQYGIVGNALNATYNVTTPSAALNIVGATSSATTGAVFIEYNNAWGNTAPAPSFNSVVLQVNSFTYTASSTTLVENQYWGTWTGAKIVSKPFQLTGTNLSVLMRTGSVDPGTSSTTQYAQPTYFIVDYRARVTGRYGEGLAPADTTLQSASTITSTAQLFVPSNFTLTAPNSANIYEIMLPIWRNVVEGFLPGPYTPAALNLSYSVTTGSTTSAQTGLATTNVALGGIGPPNVIYSQPVLLTLSLTAGLGAALPAVAGRSQVISALQTTMSDGRILHEAGWHNSPHVLYAAAAAGGGSATDYPAGTYLYRAIFRWTDAAGQVHRSAPSPVLSLTNTAGWASRQLVIPCPVYTMRGDSTIPITTPAGGGIYCELYRTDANGTVFYLVANSVTQVATNIATPVTSTTMARVTDTYPVLSSSNFTGTAYPAYWQITPESSPAPSFIWQATNQGRYFGLAQVDGAYRVYYTNIWTPGVSVEWNVLGYITVPPELGDCRSIAPMDDKMFIFGSLGVGYFSGFGPAPVLGSNGIDRDINDPNFSAVVPIPSAQGIVGTGAPSVIPSGVIYQSSQGIVLMDRSLTVQYVGAPVDPITGTFGSAQAVYGQSAVLPKFQTVVFCNPSGDSLMMDYNTAKWSVIPAAIHGPITSIMQSRNGAIYVNQQPVVNNALPLTFSAVNSASVPVGISTFYGGTTGATGNMLTTTGNTQPQMVLETPWVLTADNLAGEADLWKVQLLGEYFSPHNLKIEVATNYQPFGIVKGDTTIFPIDNTPGSPAGTVKPYPSYQFSVTMPINTRVWTVKFRISLLQPTKTTPTLVSEFARLTAMLLLSGTMQGNTRQGPGASG